MPSIDSSVVFCFHACNTSESIIETPTDEDIMNLPDEGWRWWVHVHAICWCNSVKNIDIRTDDDQGCGGCFIRALNYYYWFRNDPEFYYFTKHPLYEETLEEYINLIDDDLADEEPDECDSLLKCTY